MLDAFRDGWDGSADKGAWAYGRLHAGPRLQWNTMSITYELFSVFADASGSRREVAVVVVVVVVVVLVPVSAACCWQYWRMRAGARFAFGKSLTGKRYSYLFLCRD